MVYVYGNHHIPLSFLSVKTILKRLSNVIFLVLKKKNRLLILNFNNVYSKKAIDFANNDTLLQFVCYKC